MKYRCSSSLASNYLGHVTFCQAEKVCMFSMFMTFEHIENEVIQAKSTHLFVLLKLHTKSPHSVGVPHTPEPLLSSHCRYVYPSRWWLTIWRKRWSTSHSDELKLPHYVGVPLTLNAPSPLEPSQIRVPAVWGFFWWFEKIYTWRKSISDRPVNAILECFFSGTAKLHLNIALWDEDKRILLVGCFVIL